MRIDLKDLDRCYLNSFRTSSKIWCFFFVLNLPATPFIREESAVKSLSGLTKLVTGRLPFSKSFNSILMAVLLEYGLDVI